MSRVAGTSSYSIGSPTRRCSATDRELKTGEPYIAVLVQDPESDEFHRLDYSIDAWNQGLRPGAGPSGRRYLLLGFWRGVIPEPGAKKRLLIDDQSLLDLFEQSAEALSAEDLGEQASDGASQVSERDRLAFRFVLGLILLRKRLLIQEGSRGTTMLVRPKGTPKPPEGPALVEIIDPGLDEPTIEGVTMKLGAVISSDQPVPAAGKKDSGA